MDGFGSAEQYFKKAKELDMPFLALTNHGNVDGCLEWQKKADEYGIGPILGCEAYIVPNMKIKSQKEQRGHITILVKNLKGWHELCRLLTMANLDGFYHRPRIDFESLLNSDLSGFVILTGCTASFINLPKGIDVLIKLWDRTKGNLFLEIMPHDFDLQYSHNKKLLEIHNELKIPLVATNDCHYIDEDEWEVQEVLLAIQRKAKWKDKDRWRFELKGLHLKTEREMRLQFMKHRFSVDQINDAIENTIKIAEKCSGFRIPKQEISLPSPYENIDDNKFLDELCWQKINQDGLDEKYQKRYKQEFQLIKKKNFSRYFLIFYDLINWCKKNNIPVGPGRGSVGGSLIAYLIGITKVDPIRHHLSFARFISEDRIDFPDIDVDFAKRDREKVRDYIRKKYGYNHTCGISTDMRLKSKAAVQAVARVFDIPTKDVMAFSNTINDRNKETGLQKVIDEEGSWFAKKYPKIIYFAQKLENQVRGNGQHAAGQIISGDDLTKGTKCVLIKRDKLIVANWDMDGCEYCGLMKMDILGLSTLSVLDEAEKLIQNIPLEKFSLDDILLDDQKVFDLINSGKTAGIFQISATPTTQLAKEIHIDNFEDIVAAIALVRPGPYKSGMAGNYAKRKHGEKWETMHPIYEEVTKYTYGILVYQEQIMQVISKVAGLSESTADQIRKVIGKKRDAKEFEQYRVRFIEGCKKQKTLSKKEAEDFWHGLLEWAEYGFNRSHSVAYALIGYQTAWLKTHYPVEFACACLSFADWDNNNSEDFRQKTEILQEISSLGITIMPPKIKYSNPIRWIAKDNKLYVPFIEISGFGKTQAEKCADHKPALKPRLEGFFGKEYAPQQKEKSKSDLILEELLCYDPDKIPPKKILSKYFPFSFDNVDPSYETLKKIFGFSFPESDLLKIKSLDVTKGFLPKGLIKRARFSNDKLLECQKCELRSECDSPVMPSIGIYNVMICGEAPGAQENEFGRGFYEDAPAGKLLWEELAKYGLHRRMFHVSNVVKCYPSKTKTPKAEHINSCVPWLAEEFANLKPRLVLAFGNTNNKALANRDSGINDLSGTTEWIESITAWVCWCTHPAAVKRNSNNKEYFEKGIKNFAEKFELLK